MNMPQKWFCKAEDTGGKRCKRQNSPRHRMFQSQAVGGELDGGEEAGVVSH